MPLDCLSCNLGAFWFQKRPFRKYRDLATLTAIPLHILKMFPERRNEMSVN